MAIHNQYQKIVPFIIFALALFLLFQLIRPMITILFSSILLAYVAYPLKERIIKKIPLASVSIILAILIVVAIVLIPFSILAFGITQQGYYFYHSLSSKVAQGELFGFGCTSAESKVCLLLNQAEQFSVDHLSTFGLDVQLQKFLQAFEENITTLILTIPLIIAQIFITLVISYFILKDWRSILNRVTALLPMRRKTKNRLIREFEKITHTVIYAQLFVALIQGIIGAIGFYIFGVPFPLLLGIVLAFCALIPTIGTALVWMPASLYLILSGYASQDYWTLGKGVGLFFYSLLIISTIDNILLAKIVRAKTKVNQIVVIIGVIGGASMFGIAGIFIGPIMLPLLLTYFETFKDRFA